MRREPQFGVTGPASLLKQTSPGLAPKTVRNIHALIHRALVDAVAWKYIADNPASNVKPPKRPRTRREVWNPDQIRAFLTSVRHDRFARFVPTGTDDRNPARPGVRPQMDVRRPRCRRDHCARQSSGRRGPRAGTRRAARPRTPTRRLPSIGQRSPRSARWRDVQDRERDVLRQRLPPRQLRVHLRGRPPTTPGHHPAAFRPSRGSGRTIADHVPRSAALLRHRCAQSRNTARRWSASASAMRMLASSCRPTRTFSRNDDRDAAEQAATFLIGDGWDPADEGDS